MDFGTASSSVPGSLQHPNVQCDGCGVLPIVGTRFQSETLPDFDLCAACMANEGPAAAAGPFRCIGGTPATGTAHDDSSTAVREQLLRWVWRYFNSAAPLDAKRRRLARVQLSSQLPLVCQQPGHSRIVVGIERVATGGNEKLSLLFLDPAKPNLVEALKQRRSGWPRLARGGLQHPQYQLLFVEPGLASGAELQALKLLTPAERY